MIPRIIHYCWFGKQDKSSLSERCIQSWHKILPDYKIYEWNEDNFPIKRAPKFVREAYRVGKYAFVADYVRLYALSLYGGIYLDTDVEVIKSFDSFLSLPSFIGYEDNREKRCIQTGVIGSIKDNYIIKEWLNYYYENNFILPRGEYNTVSNVEIITKDLCSRGLVLNGQCAVVENMMHVFPIDYFCPKDPDGHITITENTVCIHYYSGSWCIKIPKKHAWLVNIIGEKCYFKLGKIKRKIFK